MKLGLNLRQLRLKKNMTLKELAKVSGVQIATLSRMEHNRMTGHLNSYEKIAKAYGMKLSELFKEIE